MTMNHDIEKIRNVYENATKEKGLYAEWDVFVEEAKEKHEAMGGMADEDTAARLIVAEYLEDSERLFAPSENSRDFQL